MAHRGISSRRFKTACRSICSFPPTSAIRKSSRAAGLTEPGTICEYASGKLVLWAPNASKLDLSRGLAALLDPAIRKIAIANPQHAPYGVAAVAAMRHAAIYDQVKGKLVLGENISQT